MNSIPHAYVDGHAKARAFDRDAADNYVRHTLIGDPELDSVLEALADLPPMDLHLFVGAGIEQETHIMSHAPREIRDFFDSLEEPSWVDHESFRPGIRVFHKNADLMLLAFVTGVLVEGFSTLIAKSFRITGRTAATNRRLMQNNRQMLEILMPGGLDRQGDGWKLSVRVRFVHARIRALLAKSDDWQHDTWGTPVSAAHVGLAISIFSKRLLDYATLLGAEFSEEERAGVMAVWRYAGYLMGIPEAILYADEAEAQKMYTVGFLCEPTPDEDSAKMANALIQAIPGVAKIKDEEEKARVLTLVYRLSRALIGNRLADSFAYPNRPQFGTLFLFRLKQQVQRMFKPEIAIRSGNFEQLMQISAYDAAGLSYNLPDHTHVSKSSPW